MKTMIKSICLVAGMLIASVASAQTTEEILAKHEAAMGGLDKWATVKTAVIKNINIIAILILLFVTFKLLKSYILKLNHFF